MSPYIKYTIWRVWCLKLFRRIIDEVRTKLLFYYLLEDCGDKREVLFEPAWSTYVINSRIDMKQKIPQERNPMLKHPEVANTI